MNRIFKICLLLLIALISFFIGSRSKNILNPKDTITNPPSEIVRTLDKYAFENVMHSNLESSKFEIGEQIKKENEYTSYLFKLTFNPNLDGKTFKTTTGQINIPQSRENQNYPVVLMFRGYIDQKLYKTGDGTRNSAAVFAKNGYITVAPDFLGYSGSDHEADDILESRFQTYITAINLVKAVPKIAGWDGKNTFIWGHSNGGQIAITTLELTGLNYPTALWAPVSKPFPYSVLFYSDEADDQGKMLRSVIAKFETLYDAEKYSLANYLDKADAPVFIQQGSADDTVLPRWSNDLVGSLKRKDKNVTYKVYIGADHNMKPAWNEAVEDDIKYFSDHLQN